LSSGDVMRVINPQIEGIMQSLAVSPDRKYCVSFSNNDQIVFCNIISGDVKVLNRYSAAPAPTLPIPDPKQVQKGNNQPGSNKNNANKNVKEKEKHVIHLLC
jgi:hypothetical protein